MSRRRFLSTASLAALAAVTAPPAWAGLCAPVGSWRVGDSFRSGCGRPLRLVAIEAELRQGACRSFALRFQGEGCQFLDEGLHRLDGPQGEVDLFLQPSRDGLVAWFNLFG
ncbi:twin-arginine translocation signal domain-containing protein [Pseudomarimonas salicorniae]|uniref:Twin-arginine translocation signal domain-containing protein n=1 Tax=Pseudomarimonas salicorniae TaxID=2933270 RepID=A0ABT0GKA3_9GAMM|nr:twin-arginine translocation signal domain-containing protein [Lysobacter sp. CAU 1642]MCK7594968.1 twin-arginine translocation signal domain-containing protein [Lysobacter sp. CAU 1642]